MNEKRDKHLQNAYNRTAYWKKKAQNKEMTYALLDYLKADQEIKWIVLAAGGAIWMKVTAAAAAGDEKDFWEGIGEAWEVWGGYSGIGFAQDIAQGDFNLADLTLPGFMGKFTSWGTGGNLMTFSMMMLVLGRMGGMEGLTKAALMGGMG